MAERMAEYVGWKDPIGNGLYNMGVTDERIIRCRDCKYYDNGVVNGRHTREPYCEEIGELSYGAFYTVDENDFCSWAKPRG